MAAKLTAERRSAALSRVRELHAAGMGLNAIAREVGVGASTVSRLARELGLDFDRSATHRATVARQVDLAALRAELTSGFLQDAARLRSEMWAPATVFNFGGKDNTYEERVLNAPPFADKLKIMQAASTAVVSALKLEAVDNPQSKAAASLLTGLAEQLGVRDDPDADTEPAPAR